MNAFAGQRPSSRWSSLSWACNWRTRVKTREHLSVSVCKNHLAVQASGTTANKLACGTPWNEPLGHYWDLLLPRVVLKGRWEPGALPVPAILCPCPCKQRCLGQAVNHSCSQHWQQESPASLFQPHVARFVQLLLSFSSLLLQGLAC